MFSSVLQSDISLIAQALNPEKHRTWQWWLTGKHMLEKDNRDSQRLLWRKRSSECCQLILIQQKSWISKTFFFLFSLFFSLLCASQFLQSSIQLYTTFIQINCIFQGINTCRLSFVPLLSVEDQKDVVYILKLFTVYNWGL